MDPDLHVLEYADLLSSPAEGSVRVLDLMLIIALIIFRHNVVIALEIIEQTYGGFCAKNQDSHPIKSN